MPVDEPCGKRVDGGDPRTDAFLRASLVTAAGEVMHKDTHPSTSGVPPDTGASPRATPSLPTRLSAALTLRGVSPVKAERPVLDGVEVDILRGDHSVPRMFRTAPDSSIALDLHQHRRAVCARLNTRNQCGGTPQQQGSHVV